MEVQYSYGRAHSYSQRYPEGGAEDANRTGNSRERRGEALQWYDKNNKEGFRFRNVVILIPKRPYDVSTLQIKHVICASRVLYNQLNIVLSLNSNLLQSETRQMDVDKINFQFIYH